MISNSLHLIIIGCGGHSKSITEIAKSFNYNILGYLDDDLSKPNVLGKIQDINKFSNCYFVLGIGGITNLKSRFSLIQSLENYYPFFINLISPYSLISQNLKIGIGNTVHPYAFVNSHVTIGNFCIINTRATIEHDCVIGNNVHISTGVILNGEVQIGNHVFIGSGTIIKNQVKITDNVIIGMGSVVLKDIQEPGIYAGNPLKIIEKIN